MPPCPSCGVAPTRDWKFCTACGSPLERRNPVPGAIRPNPPVETAVGPVADWMRWAAIGLAVTVVAATAAGVSILLFT
jgi:hypothetical protein